MTFAELQAAGAPTATQLEQLLRLVGAAACGAAVGWEREARDRSAGLRTHVLVCSGGCVMTLIALHLAARFGEATDPSRIVQGVFVGVGFLGGGVIMQARGRVRGLTTAAGIWVTAAIGVAVGVGAYAVAAAAVALTLLTLSVLRRIERSLLPTDADPDRSD